VANGHGGMRTPANPAPVSGPGALSQRTDGQPARYASGMPYGDGQDFYDIQTSAPMASTDNVAAGKRVARRSSQGVAGTAPVTPLFAPTERPEEPVTAGAAMGPGPGPMPDQTMGSVTEILARTRMSDPNVEYLRELAARLGV